MECAFSIFGYITDPWKTFNGFSPPPNGDGVRGGNIHLFELYMKILVLRNYSKVAKPAYLLSLNFELWQAYLFFFYYMQFV